jgi:N-acetylneuraminate synthase
MVATVDIGGFRLGKGQPCFLIAEAGVNHNGDLDLARRLVDAAAEAGADAVKFQTFRAERLVTPDAPKAEYQRDRTADNGSQLDMLRQLELSPEAHRVVLERCRQRGVMFLSTPFEEESANFLDALGVCAFKIPSGEVTNLPFLEHVARKGKPLIVSTGMCRLGEVESAVDAIRACGNDGLVLLHCVSNYPAAPEDANLRAMHTLGAAFGVPVGYSDHTEGVDVPLAAVALGACVLEKHFTLDRSLPGPDHAASAEPDELTALFRGVRRVEAALGHGHKTPVASETATANVARKSLVAAVDISCGSVLTPDLIAIRRPGTGLPPALREQLVGRTAREDIPAGTLLRWELLV